MREICKLRAASPLPQQKKCVAAYARVSVNSERLSRSLSAQVSRYSEYIAKNPEWVFAGVYADKGMSGTRTDNRREFNRLMTDCENGKVDIILVKSISRLARNTLDLLTCIRRLKDMGVEVRFEKERINSMSCDGELMLTVLASFAQDESRSLSENVKWSIRKKFEKGIANGKMRVFGYMWEGGAMKIVPKEAEAVRFIFSSYAEGSSPRAIAAALTENGILTARGSEWSDYGIRTVLKNITYTGNTLLQKTFSESPITKRRRVNNGELPMYFVRCSHEAIIDKDLFDTVQAEFIRRGRQRAKERDKL